MFAALYLFLATLGISPEPVRASTVDQLIGLNQQYTADYLALLQFRKSSVASLKEIDDALKVLRPKTATVKSSYFSQLAAFNALSSERSQLPAKLEELASKIVAAQQRDAAARAEAVRQGYFLPGEEINQDSIARKTSERSALIRAVQLKIEQLETEIDTIKRGSEHTDLFNERYSARLAVSEIENSISGLQRSKSQIQRDIEDEQIEINALVNRISTSEARKRDLEQRVLPELRDLLQRLTNDIGGIDAAIAQNDRSIQIQQPKVQELRQRFQQLAHRKGELDTQINQSLQELQNLNARLAQMQEWRREADIISQQRIPNQRQQLQQKQSELAQAQANANEAQKVLQQLRTQLNEATAELRREEEQKNLAERSLDQARAQLAEVNRGLARRPELEQRRSQIEQRISQTQDQLRQADSAILQARSAQAAAQSQINEAERELAHLRRQAERAQGELNQANLRIENLNKRLAELREMLNSNEKIEQEIRQTERQLAKQTQELAQSQQSLNAAQTEVQAAQVALDEALKNVPEEPDTQPNDPRDPNRPRRGRPGNPDTDPKVRAARERLQRAQQGLRQAQRQHEQNQNQVERLTQRLAQLRQGLNGDKSGIQAEIDRIVNDMLPKVTQRRDQSQAELNEFNRQIQNNPKMAAAREALRQADSALVAAESQSRQLSATLAQLQQQKSDVDTAISQMAELERRKQELETRTIPPLEQKVRNLQQRVDQIRQRAAQLQSQAQQAESRAGEAQQRVQQALGQVRESEQNIAQLERRLVELNQALTEQPQLTQRKQELESRILPMLNSELQQVVSQQRQAGNEFERERQILDSFLGRRQELNRQRSDLMARFEANNDEFNSRVREQRDLESFLFSARNELRSRQDRRARLDNDLTLVIRNLAQRQSELEPARSREGRAESAYDSFYVRNISPIDDQVSVQESEKSQLNNQVSELQTLDRSLIAIAKAITDSQLAVTRLRARGVELDAEIARVEPILIATKAEWDKLEAELEGLIDRREGIMAEAVRRQTDLKALEVNQDKVVKELK